MINYRNKKIVIVGLGLTGISCVYFFLTRGVIPRVMDTRVNPPELCKLPNQVERYLGALNKDWLLSSDIIVVSPGMSIEHPSLKIAASIGTEIIGDIELFCREVHAPIVAITGTNGKSTVTTMVGEMAKAAGLNVSIGGNIGLPASRLIIDAPNSELYVLEVSSFQLETTFNLHASAATVLNLTEDHINRYPYGFQQYCAIKSSIYNNAEVCVINADINTAISLNTNKKKCVKFGIHANDYHLSVKQDETWLCIKGERVLNTKKMKLLGRHNYINALAALALADAIELPISSSLKVLAKFSGLPHRFQLISKKSDILWINDSKATNVSSTEAAFRSIEFNGKLHLLLGGDSKSANLLPLKSCLTTYDTNIYCFGRDRYKLLALCPEIAEQSRTMEQIMYRLVKRIKSGDTVLLSPACSSSDQFKNFEQRGLIFTKFVRVLTK